MPRILRLQSEFAPAGNGAIGIHELATDQFLQCCDQVRYLAWVPLDGCLQHVVDRTRLISIQRQQQLLYYITGDV